MSDRPTITKSIEQVRKYMEELLMAAGCSSDRASVVADVFLEADMRGMGLQGLDYMPLMVRALQNGRVNVKSDPKIEKEGPAYVLVDAKGGLGQYAAVYTSDIAIRKAKETGCCVAGLVDASELYMMGYYAERIARAGLIGFLCTTWAPIVHPFGGMEPMLSTNPIAFGIPTAGPYPMILDMATSALASGRIRQAGYHNEQVPLGTGLDPEGFPTTNPGQIQQGAISPLGGPKGSGIALTVALFCGPLVGADIGKALSTLKGGGPSKARLGHFIFAINPDCFVGVEQFKRSATAFLTEVKESKKAPGFSEILIPGEREYRHRETVLKEGLTILKATWDIMAEIAEELKVEVPV